MIIAGIKYKSYEGLITQRKLQEILCLGTNRGGKVNEFARDLGVSIAWQEHRVRGLKSTGLNKDQVLSLMFTFQLMKKKRRELTKYRKAFLICDMVLAIEEHYYYYLKKELGSFTEIYLECDPKASLFNEFCKAYSMKGNSKEVAAAWVKRSIFADIPLSERVDPYTISSDKIRDRITDSLELFNDCENITEFWKRKESTSTYPSLFN